MRKYRAKNRRLLTRRCVLCGEILSDYVGVGTYKRYCPDCVREQALIKSKESMRKYREKNQETINTKKRKQYRENSALREYHKKYNVTYYQRNKDIIKAKTLAWYHKNKKKKKNGSKTKVRK